MNRKILMVHKFCCQWCHAHLGDTTATELIMGGGFVKLPITIHCLNCGRKNKWAIPKASSDSSEKQTVETMSDLEVAETIKASIAESARTWFAGRSEFPPRRDKETDAAESETEIAAYNDIAQTEHEKKEKVG